MTCRRKRGPSGGHDAWARAYSGGFTQAVPIITKLARYILQHKRISDRQYGCFQLRCWILASSSRSNSASLSLLAHLLLSAFIQTNRLVVQIRIKVAAARLRPCRPLAQFHQCYRTEPALAVLIGDSSPSEGMKLHVAIKLPMFPIKTLVPIALDLAVSDTTLLLT